MKARRHLRLVRTAAACHSGGYDECGAAACTDATCMVLPASLTCGACLWGATCLEIGETAGAESTVCAYFPRRFVRDAGA